MRGPVTAVAMIGGIAVASLIQASAHTRITTTVTWDREIAPIVQARCLACHTANGRAPMSLDSYEAARPWARAIRHEVLTRRMPKWHAARGYGEFRNDPSLSPFEIQLVVAWVDGGAPRSLPASGPALGRVPVGIDTAMAGPAVREVIRPCDERALPAGRIEGLRPRLDPGGSVRVTAWLPDGRREVLGWFRGFDPDFSPTYWLRTPLAVPAGSRVVSEVDDSRTCAIVWSIR